MRIANCRREIVLCQRGLDARHEIAAISFIVGVLELAPAALRKMTARRVLVIRPGRQRAVIQLPIARNS